MCLPLSCQEDRMLSSHSLVQCWLLSRKDHSNSPRYWRRSLSMPYAMAPHYGVQFFFEFVHGGKSEHAYWQNKHDRKKIGTFNAFPLECRTILRFFRNDSRLYISKIILFCLEGSWYSKRPAWAHGLKSKNGFKKCATGPEIFAKTSQNMPVWFGDLNFGTFWWISRDSLHIFQNRFLRWNRNLMPVILSTMNPLNRTKLFSRYKGGCHYEKIAKSCGNPEEMH